MISVRVNDWTAELANIATNAAVQLAGEIAMYIEGFIPYTWKITSISSKLYTKTAPSANLSTDL